MLAKAWRWKTCSTRSRFRLRNATRMFRWSWTRRMSRPRAFGVRQLLSRCCVDTDRAASPVRNAIAATVSLSAKTAAPSLFSLTQARGGRREHRCSIRIATIQ
jgi:hypothetical protein